MLKIPAQHSQDLPWETEVRRPGPHHRKADSLKTLRQGHSSSVFAVPSTLPALFSVSPVSGVPINAVLLLPLRHLRRYSSELRRTSSCMLVAATFHSAPPSFSKNSTISPLVSFVMSKGPWGGSRHIHNPVLALYNLDTSSK